MKTCEEMAQSVISRASAHRIARKRRIVTLAVVVLGVCVMGLGAAAVDWLKEPSVPAVQVQSTAPTTGTAADEFLVTNDAVRVSFLSANTVSGELVPLQKGVKLPNQMQMRVQDLRGLTDGEVQAVIEAEKNYADSVIASYSEGQGYYWTQYTFDNAVLTTILGGHFILSVEDPGTIEHIHFATSGTGQLLYLPGRPDAPDHGEDDTGPWEYELDETNIGSYYHPPYGGIRFNWMPDGRDARVLNEDPSMPLSELNDSITVTVTFKGGSVETHVIDLLISEHGQISAVYRGLETEV